MPRKTSKKEKSLPSDVVVFDYHEGAAVVLAQVSTASKGAARPIFLRHMPGRVPQLEAVAFAQYLQDKAQENKTTILV